MNVNDVFPSKYLKAADLKNRKVKVQIASVTVEDIGDGRKPVLFFEGKDKGMVLNKTNAMTIAAYFGNDTDGWPGKSIFLYSAKVNFNNQMVDSLRVEVIPDVSEDADDVPFR